MGRQPNKSIAQRSGLLLPPGRIRREMLRMQRDAKMTNGFLISATAVLEFSLRLLFKRARDCAAEENSTTVDRHHIAKAMEDPFLKSVFRNVFIPTAAAILNKS